MLLALLKPYILAFIPIFFAVDAPGNIPLFVGLTHSLSKRHKEKVIRESVVTATLIAVIFMFLGKVILRILGVTVADFKIGGGILLLIISTHLYKETFVDLFCLILFFEIWLSKKLALSLLLVVCL